MAVLNPYLNFQDNCMEAFDFYKSVFGGEFAMLMRFSEMPPEHPCDPSEKDKIMHVALPIGQSVLMGSDSPKEMDKVQTGNNFSISISTDSNGQADEYFKGLSQGGTVIMPMGDAFWGSYFGMCRDKFGVNWMISHDKRSA
ncbi:VOC family protein [Chitinophaga caeni]|uniref:VOC family protein n=1 Tax=Chitinophaga caeni TaxID=2029983 RepID=A0A291QYW0_9BACT|nr:VOC family protein [Chitinophaga caeni]ATL49166.1 VOC family protein [Chitinophaga caeni]